jgi:hypothetical protein
VRDGSSIAPCSVPGPYRVDVDMAEGGGTLRRQQRRQQIDVGYYAAASGEGYSQRLNEGEFWSSSSEAKTSDRMTPESEESREGEEPEGEAYELEERGLLRGDEKDEGEEEDEFDGAAVDDIRRRGRRRGSVASFQLYTPDEERSVVRKFDRRLVVFVALLYMVSFLDRSSMFLRV